ncbi:hypothetical protein ACP275_04G123800 [Erythranthe tilingii]
MGCGVSRPFDGNGLVLPAKLRPIFVHRLEEIKMRRHTGQYPPLKDTASTPSKKELLLHDLHELEDEHKSAPSSSNTKSASHPHSHHHVIHGKKNLAGKEEATAAINSDKHKNVNDDDDENDKKKEKGNVAITDGVKGKDDEDVLTDTDDDDDDDEDDDEDDERRIGRGDFPGSPSFRGYIKEDGGDKKIDIGKKNAIKDTIPKDDTVLSKESSENKKVKRGKKKKSFRRRVLPKGGQAAVKNLFNAATCYTPPPSAAHDHHAHLLTGKPNA